MNEDDAITSVHRKIDREKALINAANTMRQSTNNPAVLSRLETQIRDGRRNIDYLEGKARELQMKKLGSDMGGMHIRNDSNGSSLAADGPQGRRGNPLTPPPKDGYQSYTDQGGYGEPGSSGYSQLSGGHTLMPPRAPYASGPASGARNTKPNYSKLGKFRQFIYRKFFLSFSSASAFGCSW
jgi:hypothetical protein